MNEQIVYILAISLGIAALRLCKRDWFGAILFGAIVFEAFGIGLGLKNMDYPICGFNLNQVYTAMGVMTIFISIIAPKLPQPQLSDFVG